MTSDTHTARSKAALADVLITSALARRTPRRPDYAAENRALNALAQEMVANPSSLPRMLVDLVLELCSAGSAGIGVAESAPGGAETFCWAALAGAWRDARSGVEVAGFGPCEIALASSEPQLFSFPARHFTDLDTVRPPIVEALVVPLRAGDRPRGAFWILSHDSARRFDREDARVMTSIAGFAAAALHTSALTDENARLHRRTQDEHAERARMDEALRASEAQLGFTLDATQVGQWTLNLATGAASRTLRHDHIFGYESPLPGWTYEMFLDHVHPDDRARVDRAYSQARETGRDWECECRIVRSDRTVRWIWVRGSIYASPCGRPRHMTGLVMDITARKQAAQALSESEARYRTLFDSIDEGFCVIEVMFDAHGRPHDYRYLETNPAFGRHTGVTQARGKTIHELLPDIDQSWLDVYGKAVTTGEPIRFQKPVESLNRWFDVYAFRLGAPAKRQLGLVFKDITGRRKAEEALRESRIELARQARFLDATLANVGDYIYVWNRAKQFVYANRKLEKLWGLTRDEYVGKTNAELGDPPALCELFARQIEQVMATSEAVTGETAYTSPTGVYGYYDYTLTPVIAADGSVDRIVGVSHDTTEHKRAEALVEAHKDSLEMIVVGKPLTDILAHLVRVVEEQAGGGRVAVSILLLDEDGRLRVVASTGLPEEFRRTIDGLEPNASLGACPAAVARNETVITPDIAADPQWKNFKAPASELGFKAAWSMPITAADGRALGTFGTYFREQRGPTPEERKTVGMLARAAALAIERKRAEEALRASEKRLRTAFEIDTVGIIFWSADFTIAEANDAFLATSGFTREEAAGRTWQALTPTEFHARSRQAVADLEATGRTAPYEKQYLRKDGSRWWGLFAPRRLDTGEVVEYVLDITERKQAEEAVREEGKRKDEFLATLAHELRNPLAPLKNALDILRVREGDWQAVSRVRETMEHQVDHLTRLVDDLMEISRITRGKIELRRARVDVGSLVQSALETNQPLIDAGGHQLKIVLPRRPLFIDADPVRLTQVIANLLNNAVKYTERAGRIELGAAREKDDAVVRVRDAGIGISAKLLPKVFDLFTQAADSSTRTQGGLGIGLTLVKHLVELHGGSVAAHSEGPGRGSEFVFRLPAAAENSNAADETRAVTAASSTVRRILVVDDNRAAADTLAELLELYGNEVRVVHDGQAALDILAMWRPDVMLLDIGMPRMDGHEVARRVRRQPELEGVLLIAVTGWGQQKDRACSRAAGFDHHLLKPLDLQALRALLESASA